METIVREVVHRLPGAAPDLEFVAFVNEELTPDAAAALGGDVEVHPMRVRGRSRVQRVLAEQFVLPRRLRRNHIDLLHSLGSTGPARPGVVSVVSVNDVIYAAHPEAHTRAMRMGMRVLVPLGARRAQRVITLSRTAASEISSVLDIDRTRIDVIHLAGVGKVTPAPEDEVRDTYGLGSGPLVLSPSARRGHKNLRRLLQAWAQVDRGLGATLVLPGFRSFQDDELAALARELGIDGQVRFLGWIPQAHLETLYSISTCLVFPSLAEGFGLPVLEAMDRGLPVACSNASSLPEVAGDAALYFDPRDVSDISDAINRLLTDAHLREELKRAGYRQASGFSWARTARETVDAYRRAWMETPVPHKL